MHDAATSIPLSEVRPYIVDVGDNGLLSDSGDYWTTEDDLRRLLSDTISAAAEKSINFIAPAITIADFTRPMMPAIRDSLCPVPTLFLLSDQGELDYDVGPYDKSLLFREQRVRRRPRPAAARHACNAYSGRRRQSRSSRGTCSSR